MFEEDSTVVRLRASTLLVFRSELEFTRFQSPTADRQVSDQARDEQQ